MRPVTRFSGKFLTAMLSIALTSIFAGQSANAAGQQDANNVHGTLHDVGPLTTTITVDNIDLRTYDGHYLTAVNGGGLGGPNTGPNAVALHSDAWLKGPWETLYMVKLGGKQVAFRTTTGYYLTAVNGGGMGGPNDSSSPFHTDATVLGGWEHLTLEHDLSDDTYALRTATGNYVTFVNNGGYGGPNNVPIHTDARALGAWETFTLDYLN